MPVGASIVKRETLMLPGAGRGKGTVALRAASACGTNAPARVVKPTRSPTLPLPTLNLTTR
jgi:hypothetical protein